jgi:hypothetical protein
MFLIVESEREKTMQIPPFTPPVHKYDEAEVEAKEQELQRDFAGLPPKEYLADWLQTDRPVRRAFSFRKWLKEKWPGKT